MKRFLAMLVMAFLLIPAGVAAAAPPEDRGGGRPEGPNRGVCNAFFRGSERGQEQKQAHGQAFQRLIEAAEAAGLSVEEFCFGEAPPPPPPPPPACEENGLDAFLGTPLEGVASGVIHESVEPLAGQLSPDLAAAVHTINCQLVVPIEEAVDDFLGTNQP